MGIELLHEGRESLERIRDLVRSAAQDTLKEKEFSEKEETLERMIEEKEKEVLLEVDETLRKRKKELEASFKAEEEKVENLKKSLNSKREKVRSGKVSERTKAETERFFVENEEIRKDTKRLFRGNRVPRFFNSSLFYTLFMPRGIKDILICLVVFLLLFGGLPFLLWKEMIKSGDEIYLLFLSVGSIFLFGGLYLFLFNKSRTKYREFILKGSDARNRIRNNKKIAKKIAKNIKKDKDDSGYGLQEYDSGLESLRMQSEELEQRKKEALRGFEEESKRAIAEEIKEKYRDEIRGKKEELFTLKTELAGIREGIKQGNLSLSEQFETYLGKENVKEEVLSELLQIMEERGLSTIGEALEARKQKRSVEEIDGKYGN